MKQFTVWLAAVIILAIVLLIMWTDAEYRLAFQSLYFEYHKLKSERDQYKTENENLKHERDYLDKSLASLQEDYNHLESQHDELFRRYEMLNELI